jgi:indole-3-glycerol phosphate synthase
MILDRIVADKRQEVELVKNILPLAEIQRLAAKQLPPLDFAASLKGENIRLIAEVKKASPSRGLISPDFSPIQVAQEYVAGGAAAISVLTEVKYFMGSLEYLREINNALVNRRLPLLRKDFIFEPYQVYESRAYGADALLLIVAILTPVKLVELLNLSHELGMDCLVETHNALEVEIALQSGAGIIGINNRDLQTLQVDINTTGNLRKLIPAEKIAVSESGIKDHRDILKLREWQIDAVLIGEALMTAPNIVAKIKELL